MAFRPLSVISAVRQPGDTEVSTDRADLQSELRRSAQKIRVLEKELVTLNAEHKGFVLAYASLEGSSYKIERHLRQEIEAADMQRSKMQQGYKEQLHEQHGLVEELRKENECLMEDKAALTKEVSVLRRQLDIVQSRRATPAGPANMDLVRVTKELSREPNFVQTPRATALGAATMASHPLGSSPSSQQRAISTTAHPLQVYQNGLAVVHRVCEPEEGSSYGQLHGGNPRKVTFRRRAAWLSVASCARQQVLGSSHCPDDPLTGTITSASVTNHHLSSPLEVEWLPAELDADAAADTSSSPSPLISPVSSLHSIVISEAPSPMANVEAQITMGPSPESPKGTPMVNRLQRPYLANPSNELTPQVTLCSIPRTIVEALTAMSTPPESPKGTPMVNMSERPAMANVTNTLTPQARSPLILSIDGTAENPHAGSPMSGVARLSGADSPTSSSSVASHNSDVLDCLMEDLAHVTKELSRGPGFVQTTQATPAGPAPMVCEPEGGSWYGQLHGSNPRKVTFRRHAEPSDPIPLSTLSSPSPHPYSFIPPTAIPLLVPSALCGDASSSPSLSSSPVHSIHSAFKSELPSPRTIVEALTAMSTPPESPKGTPMVSMSERPAMANVTNTLTPQARSPLILSIDGPSSQQRAISTTVHPLQVYQNGLAVVHRVCEPEEGSLYGQLHGSNPRKVTFRRRAAWLSVASCACQQVLGSSHCPDDPLKGTITSASVTNHHLSSPLEVEWLPAELDADAAADTSSSPSLLISPVSSLHSIVLSEAPSPMANVEAQITMSTPPESPKGTSLVNMSERPAMANVTNTLTPQARVTSGLAASVQTPGKATPLTSAGGRHLSAFLQLSPSPCLRPRTSPPRVVVTGNRSACSIRSSRGFEASPGTPRALYLLSPARALGSMLRAVGCFSIAIPPNAAARSVSTSPTMSIRALVSSPTALSPPRAVESNLRSSLTGARAFGYTPTAPFAEPVHSVMSFPDQGFSFGLSLLEAQGPTFFPAVQSAVPMSSAALVPLQLAPVQQPLQAHGPSAHSVAASNGRTRAVYSSAVSSRQVHRRSSTSSSTADRPAWSTSFSCSSAVHTCLAEDATPVSRRRTSVSLHRAASSTQPSPSPVSAVADNPAAEPSSVQAIRRTGSNAAAARLLSTAKTEASTRTAAQPGAVRSTAAQPNAGRAAVQSTARATRAGQTKAGPAAPVTAAQRPAMRSSKAAASTTVEQPVARHRQAPSGRSDVVQSESGLAPVELRQTKRGKRKMVNKDVAPIRTQPARRAKDPGHTWKF
ncbi:TPA: hypothetical protein ACH3X1_014190 [Trebouxia sp. C0004]